MIDEAVKTTNLPVVPVLFCVDELYISHWLPTHWALVQPLGTPLAGHIVATRAEHG